MPFRRINETAPALPAAPPGLRRRAALYLLLTLLLLVVGGVRAERLPVRIYTSADGLGSGFIDNLYRDSRGFIWVCTRDGLSRFDGSRFVTYQIGEKNAPPGIEHVFEMPDGTYLISTTGGTYHFDPNKTTTADTDSPRLDAERISGIRGTVHQDRSGAVWLGSDRIYRVVSENGKPTFQPVDWGIPPKQPALTVYGFGETPDGSLWASTSWGLVRRLPDARLIVYNTAPELFEPGGAFIMMADRAGRIWLAVLNQLFLINPETPDQLPAAPAVIERPLIPTEIRDIAPDAPFPVPEKPGEIYSYRHPELIAQFNSRRFYQTADGDVWIATLNNLLQIDDGILRLHTNAEGLPNVMGRMVDDIAGNLWIAGRTGLARLNHRGMITLDQRDGAASSEFFGITEGPDGTQYLATRNAHLTRIDGTRLESVRPALPENTTSAWTSRFLFVDSGGDFWLLSTGGLYRFSNVRRFKDLDGRAPSRVYRVEDGLRSNILFQIYEDSKGAIWVSTRGTKPADFSLARLERGADKFRTFTEADGFPPNISVSTFAEDRAGRLWLGFYEGGLARFDGARFDVVSQRAEFPARGVISDLHFDAAGRLWLSSSNTGLFRIDEPHAAAPVYTAFTTAEGLASNNIRSITEDAFGRIYVGSARGVDRLSPDTGRVQHYSVSDGLAADFVVDARRDRAGHLWFVTSDGVSRLVPQPDEPAAPPPVLIGGLRIAGVRQPVSELGQSLIERAELAYTQNNLQIDFFGLDFRARETLRFRYKLEGADTEWSAPTELRTVTFANLQPGGYRFLVQAVDSEGVASREPAVVAFRIRPPFWARWWFVLLAALLVAFVIFTIYRYRTAHLRAVNLALEEARRGEENLRRAREERLAELEKVRARIATDLHDDIGASLTQIAVLSEVAQAQSRDGGKPAAAKRSLTRITRVSNELVEAMSDIVWSINPAKDHLSDLTQRMRRFASDVLSARGVAVQFRAPGDDPETVLETNLRREVFLIFKESVSNIVKHADARRVTIDLRAANGRLRLEIADDGRGLEAAERTAPETAEYGGNGIPSMEKRAALLGGRLTVAAGPDGGTVVRLDVPLEQILRGDH